MQTALYKLQLVQGATIVYIIYGATDVNGVGLLQHVLEHHHHHVFIQLISGLKQVWAAEQIV